MKKIGKKHKNALEAFDKKRFYSIDEGIDKVKKLSHVKFDETVNAVVSLGIDPEKGEYAVRGSFVLPNQYKKSVRVIAFVKSVGAEEAKLAGADFVGAEDLIEKISAGWLEFDYAVATVEMMGLVGKVAKILGPKGLLPNKKNGTIALNVVPVIKELKSGLVFFKNDKNAQVNFAFGKVSFSVSSLVENLNQFIKSLKMAKPNSTKGIFIKKLTINSAMGIGVPIDMSLINN